MRVVNVLVSFERSSNEEESLDKFLSLFERKKRGGGRGKEKREDERILRLVGLNQVSSANRMQ